MSIEQEIRTTLKEALADYTMKYPILAKKKTMAALLDVSTEQINKLIRNRTLVEEEHFTRITEGGDPMFYVAEVVARLKPLRAKEKVV